MSAIPRDILKPGRWIVLCDGNLWRDPYENNRPTFRSRGEAIDAIGAFYELEQPKAEKISRSFYRLIIRVRATGSRVEYQIIQLNEENAPQYESYIK